LGVVMVLRFRGSGRLVVVVVAVAAKPLYK
jgi:hypothetical protein